MLADLVFVVSILGGFCLALAIPTLIAKTVLAVLHIENDL